MGVNELKGKLVFTENSPQGQYEELYKLNIGDVFKVQSDYGTVMQRIEDYKPQDLVFKVFPITPGTSLYTMYGSDHCVIIDKCRILPK